MNFSMIYNKMRKIRAEIWSYVISKEKLGVYVLITKFAVNNISLK